MACRGCPRATSILDETSARFPGRRTTSDGICPSAAHSAQNPTSDHEPDARGIAHAVDVSQDPAHGVDIHRRMREIVAGGVPRWLKYFISDHQIYNPFVAPYWRPYNGPNPHEIEGHSSILTEYEDDTESFWTDTPGTGDLTVDQADRIIAVLGEYEQDTRRLLIGVSERIADDARHREGLRTRRILDAIDALADGDKTRAKELLSKAADDDGTTVQEITAAYQAELDQVAEHLDGVVMDTPGLDTHEQVTAAVQNAKADLAALK